MQDEGEADASRALRSRVSGPVVDISGGTFRANLLKELDAIERDVLGGSHVRSGVGVFARGRALNYAHIDILLAQVGPRRYDGQVHAPSGVGLAGDLGTGRNLESKLVR